VQANVLRVDRTPVDVNLGWKASSPIDCGTMEEVGTCESFTIGDSLWHHLGLVEPASACCLMTCPLSIAG